MGGAGNFWDDFNLNGTTVPFNTHPLIIFFLLSETEAMHLLYLYGRTGTTTIAQTSL